MERSRRVSFSVALNLKHQLRGNRTRVLYESRRAMKLILILSLFVWNACSHFPQPKERKIIPIVDKNNEIHIYKSSNPPRLDNDYALYCMEHYTWETIQVRYKPDQLSKLRSEEYTVRKHPKSS